MPKFYHTDILDNGLSHVGARITAGDTVNLHVIKAYAAADSYATVVGNSIGSVALAGGDLTLGNQGTNGRQLAVASKSISAASAGTSQYDQGTATSGGAATLSDTSKSWTTNAHAGRALNITGGTGSGQVGRIASNTATQLTVSANWATPPDATSTYTITDDLHVAVVNATASKVYIVTDETSNQVIVSGNPITSPAFNAKQNQPS